MIASGVSSTTIRPPARIATRSARCSTSPRSWVVRRIVRPSPRRLGDELAGRAPSLGVHPRRRLVEDQAPRDRPPRAMASASRWRSPPDSRRTRVPATAASPTSSMRSSGAPPAVVERRVQADEIPRRRARLQSRAALEHQPDPGTQARAAASRILPEHAHRSRVRACDSPRRSRRSSSCRRRSGRAGRRARPAGRRDPRRRAPSGRHTRPRSPAISITGSPASPRRRAGRSRRSADQGELALELGVGQLANLDGPQDPVAVDEVRLRPGRDPVRALGSRRSGRRPSATSRRTPRRSRAPAPAGSSISTPTIASPAAGMLGELRLEERELVAAGHAARPPEVEQHRAAAERREVERDAVQGRPDDRAGRAGRARCHSPGTQTPRARRAAPAAGRARTWPPRRRRARG